VTVPRFFAALAVSGFAAVAPGAFVQTLRLRFEYVAEI